MSNLREAMSSNDLVEPDPDHIESVREAWTSYVAAAYPDEQLGMIQRRELRRAFYMGAWAMFCDVGRVGLACHRSEQAGSDALQKIWDELSDFMALVRANQA